MPQSAYMAERNDDLETRMFEKRFDKYTIIFNIEAFIMVQCRLNSVHSNLSVFSIICSCQVAKGQRKVTL